MKILLIGVGGFGKNHLRVWNELNQDLYVADLSHQALDKCKIYNINKSKISTNFHDFLDKVDAVDIVTPTDFHYDICKECLVAGKDVFVEKPITMYSHEARRLIELSDEYNRILQVGHIFRYNPASKYIKNQIDNGALGKIRHLFGHYMGFKRARTDVGVTQTDSIHFFDLFNFFLGKKPTSVTAVTKDYLGRGMDDTSVVLLDYGKEMAQVESGYFPPGNWRDIVIMGDKASIVSNIVKQDVALYNNYHKMENNIWTAIDEGVVRPKIITKEPLYQELRTFLDSVKTRNKPSADGESGFQTLKIVEAAYQSSKKGKKVSIDW